MTTFNEQNTPALGFLSGLVQSLSPTLIGELNAKRKQRDVEKRQQDIKDLAIYKEGQANKRNNAKLKFDAELKEAERDQERRDLVLNANNRAAELKYKTDAQASEGAKDRANKLKIAKLRESGDFNINNFGKGGGYTKSDYDALIQMAESIPKYTNKDRVDSISGEWIKGNTAEMRDLSRKLYSAAEKIKNGEPLTDAEKAFVEEQRRFGNEAPKQDLGYFNYLNNRNNNWGFGLPQTPTKLKSTESAPKTSTAQDTTAQEPAKLNTKRENTWDSIDPATKDLIIRKIGGSAGEAAKRWNKLPESAKIKLVTELTKQRQDAVAGIMNPQDGYRSNISPVRGFESNAPKGNYNTKATGKTPVREW
jgi:hypothetical protein